jgi:hypothetical protein
MSPIIIIFLLGFIYLRSSLEMTCFFLIGMLFKASSNSTLGGILQKSAPKLLMTFADKVGGSVEQQKYVLLAQESALKPTLFPFSL